MNKPPVPLSPDQRIAGVLIPVFAVRGAGDLGIGDTWGMREFIDWAATVGFTLVKILPINETGGDHSPYNAISSVALEPTTLRVSPDALSDLRRAEYEEEIAAVDPALLAAQTVDYPAVKQLKRKLLERAFTRFHKQHLARKSARAQEFMRFLEEQAGWIEDYQLFRAFSMSRREQDW